jgi:hypothetical protein
MNELPTPQQIRRWFPGCWTEIAGNSKVIETWKNFIANGLCNALFTGLNGSGKTRAISLGIRALLCPNRTELLSPCGKCPACKATAEGRTVHAGVFTAITGSEYSFYPVDCETVTADELDSLHTEVKFENETTIIYLDEVAALRRRRLEGRLLKVIDETEAIWIASAISLKRKKGSRKGEWTERLSKEMKRRFAIKVGTSLPHPDDFYTWIEGRARAWEIVILEPATTIPLMVKRSRCRVGYVVNMFSAAATRNDRSIGPNDVKGFNLDTED